MYTQNVTTDLLRGSVIAVPPMARDANYQVCPAENKRLIQYMEAGGIKTLLYGGNAVFYHIRPSEYAKVLQIIAEAAGPDTWVVPSVGPTYGMMMDQAEVLADFDFPTVMILPQKDIADGEGIAAGIERFVDKYQKPVVLYLKFDRWLSVPHVRKLVDRGAISWIKYAVVLPDPANDPYLSEIVQEVPSELMISGIGEQPAIVHVDHFKMSGFTSGCVCVAPKRSMEMLHAIQHGDLASAEKIRQQFCGLEDLRNGINPIRVLHRAVELAEIAKTGPMLPLLGPLQTNQDTLVAAAAKDLKAWNAA